MFEKKAKEWFRNSCYYETCPACKESFEAAAENIFQQSAEFGYNKAMKEWRDCFMSCSSPYCADKFRDIQCNGMLGNMTKEVKMEEAKQKFNAISTGVDEYIMRLEEENRKLRDKNEALERYAELCKFSVLEETENESHI